MQLQVSIFASGILPICVIAGVGFMVARFREVGVKPLAPRRVGVSNPTSCRSSRI